jgi:hypothetical protein
MSLLSTTSLVSPTSLLSPTLISGKRSSNDDVLDASSFWSEEALKKEIKRLYHKFFLG